MKKKKIYFLAPKNKWWTYFYYKDIVSYLDENYWENYDVYFLNTFFDYIKLHFIKSDIIFSIIPFIFKPLFTKKYIFNLHWNYKIERKNKWLWVKLLYLTELNLWFSNKIMLTSYYLADKLNFREKYDYKISISPLFIDKISLNNKNLDQDNIKILTVSSANFLNKWLWVYNIAKELFKINNKNIYWKIILPWNVNNKKIILDKIKKIDKPKNITYKVYDFIEREKLDTFYLNTDIFIYASNFETWWWVIMEACSFWKPIILLENDLWKYIFPNYFITRNIEKKFKYIIMNYNNESNNSLEFIKKYLIWDIINKLIKNEILNYNTNL